MLMEKERIPAEKSEPLFRGEFVETARILYTPSEFAKQSLFHVQEIGSLQATKPHVSRREKLSSYLFFLVRSGSGKLRYRGAEYALKQGDCVFIDCRQSYSHATEDDLWQLSWVHFDGPTAEDVYRKYEERGGQPAFSPECFSDYTELFTDLFQTAAGSSYVRDMELNTGLCRLLAALMKDSWHPEKNQMGSKKNTLREIARYLDAHYNEKITLDQLAESYYINKFYLTRIFREQYGMSIGSYLTAARITQAKHLLRFTDKTAEQIGADCGLGDIAYFSRVFKRVEGMTLREYRRQWRG